MAKHSKPVTGAELHKFLRELGCNIRQGAGKPPVAVIDGTEVRITPDDKKSVVGIGTMGNIASALHTTRQDLEATLGRRQIKGGKPKAKVSTPDAGPTRAEVERLASDLVLAAGRVERWLKQGMHGTALYRRVHGALTEANRALEDYPPHADRAVEDATYQRLSPDDSRYRPTSPDSITTGVARATGLTVTAAKRGKTYTRWEHGQRSS